jgi:hypothetical protein
MSSRRRKGGSKTSECPLPHPPIVLYLHRQSIVTFPSTKMQSPRYLTRALHTSRPHLLPSSSLSKTQGSTSAQPSTSSSSAPTNARDFLINQVTALSARHAARPAVQKGDDVKKMAGDMISMIGANRAREVERPGPKDVNPGQVSLLLFPTM